MGLWQRLFGGKKSTLPSRRAGSGNMGPGHPAAELINEAVRIADEGIGIEEHGQVWRQTTNLEVLSRLLETIDRAMDVAPSDVDLLVLKPASSEQFF